MDYLEYNNLVVVRRTRGKIPGIPYKKIKDVVLGTEYVLDISFVNTATSTYLHIEHKKKPGPANTLAFSYTDISGEIIMHLETIRRQAPRYNRTYHDHLLFLCIHSMLHLRGYVHGSEMERQEELFYHKLIART